MTSHKIDYTVLGDDLQCVEVELDPQETVVAEAGGMLYMEEDVAFETRMGDGSEPDGGAFDKLAGAARRTFTGESLFLTHFTNQGRVKRRVAFAAPYPGKILAVDLDDVGGELLCQKAAFLCAVLGTEIGIAFNRKFGRGLFGGEGFILQCLRGNGRVFLHAGGTAFERHLEGETLRVDTGCLVAFETGIAYDIERAGNLTSMVFGGEGIFLATLRGTGRVWLQSLPFSRLADRILANAPRQGGNSTGEGSVLSGAVKLFQK